ncbi:MAG: DUF1569 domain-containing protein [Saprospiraceae bacterium]|nr:DUF1569 domain-containing protein [Saprospiraceae bacterium]
MNISNIEERLSNLNETQTPLWGMMTPQHMVEHLSSLFAISLGKVRIEPFYDNDAQVVKKEAFYSKRQFPKNVQIKGSENKLFPLRFENLGVAKEKLLNSITQFNSAGIQNPDAIIPHPVFGPLTFTEWEIFHDIHINHHFSQFEI